MRKRVKTAGLAADAFTRFDAGQTMVFDVDLASVHDLSAGGTFKISTYGAIPYADADSTTLTGQALAYNSNQLNVKVDGRKAAQVKRAFHPLDERTVVESDCTDSQKSDVLNALKSCKSLASAASTAAKSGSASKFQEYFKSNKSTARQTVSERFAAVATECGSSTGGATTQYCSDVFGGCDSVTLAYTVPSRNLVVNCPLYFSHLQVLVKTCHVQDMAATTIHEFTHAPGVYSPGTKDNGYGYAAATALDSEKAIDNADSYALYANGTLHPKHDLKMRLNIG
jgi:deuterolysin